MAIVGEVASRLGDVVSLIGNVALWLQTLGILLVFWMVFQVVGFLLNRKRMKEVYKIKEDMNRIEGKIDKILARKK